MHRIALLAAGLVLLSLSCSSEKPAPVPDSPRPSILLVTLDTTRSDAIGPDAEGVETPFFNEIAGRGVRFTRAYATAPQTLPSHASMMTGLYPAGHGVHENSRYLPDDRPLLAEALQAAGYRTAAFVSAFPLARRFGLARGFQTYDDRFPEGKAERSSKQTTDEALRWLEGAGTAPFFLWVHYFDPHSPYEIAGEADPSVDRRVRYLAEVASMDEQLGRLIRSFAERTGGEGAVIVAGDHGEALGDHGEAEHGNLLYEGVMRVPLVIAGPGASAGRVSAEPASIRRIHDTVMGWAALPEEVSLVREAGNEVVLGEAMQPFLNYGWQPQVMAIDGPRKAIQAGQVEIYDVVADPGESNDLGAGGELSRPMREALRDYPIPSSDRPASSQTLTEQERRQLASLGYVSSEAAPVVRDDAPRPRDMAHLFEKLDRSSDLFVRERYEEAIPVIEGILAEDPRNLSLILRLAVSHSELGRNEWALESFRRAQSLAPHSSDVRHFLAMHYARTDDWERAIPLLEEVLRETPDRLPAIEALALLRERSGDLREALALRERALSMKTPEANELVRTGQLAMAVGDTSRAIQLFELARALQGPSFRHDLELGVLYLAARQLDEARAALDRVPVSHPEFAMAAFKRAQVSVLLAEPDRASRIEAARRHADETTRVLIANERLFEGY